VTALPLGGGFKTEKGESGKLSWQRRRLGDGETGLGLCGVQTGKKKKAGAAF